MLSDRDQFHARLTYGPPQRPMSNPAGTDATLLQTIAELRHDVNRLVDEQLARVRALDEKQAATAPAERRYSAPQPPPAPAPRPPRAQPAARAREVVEEPPPPAPSDDPSQRLDALARHLDGRLRRSNGRSKGSSGDASDRPPRGANGTHGSSSETTS